MANKRRGKFSPGTWLEKEMAMSRAYLELSGFAPQLLVLFLLKRDFKNKVCRNGKQITMTYAELENIYNQGKEERNLLKDGVSRPRIIRALDDLLAKGFLEIVRRGGAFQQDKTVYGLTDDWRYWRPGQTVRTREKDTRKRGYQGKPEKQISRTKTLPIHTHGNVTHARPVSEV